MNPSTSLVRLPCEPVEEIALRAEDSTNSYDTLNHQDDFNEDSGTSRVHQIDARHYSSDISSTKYTNITGAIKKITTTSSKNKQDILSGEDSHFPCKTSGHNNEVLSNITIFTENNETQCKQKTKDIPIDVINFLETVYKLLECPVCMNHMTPPILLCESGHNICHKCKPFMTNCPQCRGSFIQIRNFALECIAENLSLIRVDEVHDQNNVAYNSEVAYGCPLERFTRCNWQGGYLHIWKHIKKKHENKILNLFMPNAIYGCRFE